ncbi:MAG: segregation/condensation protein A, partial [Defluviitaleaceae bacterium]|nr:segregation/condensation protein A [Defluviitaleaceae bacterium]
MEFKLEKFEGPLDLLLRLIQRAEIDIHDIPISQITAEYMAVVAGLPPDMEQMSEFLVMAATLLEIKARML